MPSDSPTLRQRNYAPAEELARRLEQVPPPRKLSDADLAILLAHHRHVTVKNCALSFEHQGERYTFKSPQSVTCQPENNGKRVLIHFVPDFPDLVYVLRADGSFLEVIERSGRVAWFDEQAVAAGQAEYNRQLGMLKKLLGHLQGREIAAEHDRRLANLAKMQQVRTFPLPARTPDTGHRAADTAGTDRTDSVPVAEFQNDRAQASARRVAPTESLEPELTAPAFSATSRPSLSTGSRLGDALRHAETNIRRRRSEESAQEQAREARRARRLARLAEQFAAAEVI